MSSARLQEAVRYLRNSGWMVAEKLLMLGVGLAATVVLARYLGPQDFGYLNYALALVSLLTIVCHLGLTGLVVKELRLHPDQEDRILSSVFVLKVAASLLAYGALLATYFIEPDDHFLVLAIVGLTLLFTPFEILIDWFQSRVKAKYAALAGMVGQLGGNGLKIVLAVLGLGLTYIALAHVAVILVTSLLLVGYAVALKGAFRFDFSWALSKRLLGKSFLIFLGSLSAVIYLKIDQVMLQYMLGNYAVGQYAAASKLSEAWYIMPTIVMASLFPKMIDLNKGDPRDYARFMQTTLDVLFVCALCLSVAVFFLSEQIISILYGAEYSLAAKVLAIHIFASVFVFMRALFSKWIIIEEVFLFSLITQGLGALSNIVLNYFLISSHGAEGAAMATLISYSIAGYFSLLLSRRTRGMFGMMTRSMCLSALVSVPNMLRALRRG